MNKPLLALSIAVSMALFGGSVANAADIVPVNVDDPGEGYNDTTPVAPVGGNPGTTKGEQRRIVAQFAADLWGAVLVSDQTVFVQAEFNPLGANVLGQAGATFIFRDFPGAAYPGTWYSAALAEAITGEDLTGGVVEIFSQFSSDFTFYYGLDDNTPAGQVNFLDVIMHEYGHGLGFQNFENESTGQFQSGFPDVYSVFTFDNTTGKFWTGMTVAERQASAINNGNVVFTGASAVAGAGLILGPRTGFAVTSGPAAGFYDYGTASFGPPVSEAAFTGTVVVATDAADGAGPSTTDGCSPINNPGTVAGKIALMDRGTCGFVVKAKNAQDAGAVAVIIANNVAGTSPPGLGGADPTIVIPTISITLAAGTTFKANAPLQVGFITDNTKLQGADDAGRPRLFMPNPVQGGSSGSHYDTALSPNALMEPAINNSLFAAANLDISPNLLQDTGWVINNGNAMIDGCDTGVDIVNDAGLIFGANVQARSNVCLIGATKRGQYQGCMDAYTDEAVAAGILTAKQKGKVMSCAAKVGKSK